MRGISSAAASLMLLAAPPPLASQPAALPPSLLAVRPIAGDSSPGSGHGSAWTEFWRSDRAPTRWDAPHPAVTAAVAWRALAPGVEAGDLALAGTGEAWRMRAVLVRIDPARVRMRLVSGSPSPSLRPVRAWRVEDAPDSALVAVNAGQFSGGVPWGWVVRAGLERRAPGRGPLATALAVDTAGRVRWLRDGDLAAERLSGAVREAFQSYPTLLVGGEVPAPLRASGRGVSVTHRDARLVACTQRDGRLLLVLTRFDALGESFASVPFGPTAPETAALAGALGCTDAVMLDGGISGQLLVREPGGDRTVWRGWRRVPLGLVVYARQAVDGRAPTVTDTARAGSPGGAARAPR